MRRGNKLERGIAEDKREEETRQRKGDVTRGDEMGGRETSREGRKGEESTRTEKGRRKLEETWKEETGQGKKTR